MKLPMLMLLVSLAASCQGKKASNNNAVATSNETTDTPTTTTPTETPDTTVVEPVVEETSSGTWILNAENCAALGQAYVEGKADCEKIRTKEACDALGNGSIFEGHLFLGKCIGPRLQDNEANCAAKGKSYDAADNDCTKIRNQADCDALGNGSIFSPSKRECIGPAYLPSTENCAAFGMNFDAGTASCTLISTQEECAALASDAKFMMVRLDRKMQQACVGRCIYRDSDLDQCHDLYGQKDLDDLFDL